MNKRFLVSYATTKVKPVLWPLVTSGTFKPLPISPGNAESALRERREKEGSGRFSLVVDVPIPPDLRAALERTDDA